MNDGQYASLHHNSSGFGIGVTWQHKTSIKTIFDLAARLEYLS